MRRSSTTLLLPFPPLFFLQRPIFASKKEKIKFLIFDVVVLCGVPWRPHPWCKGVSFRRRRRRRSKYNKRVTESHYDLLSSVLGDNKKEAQDAIFYSYTNYINGFAAMLEEDTANAIAKYPGVVSVFPNKRHKLHTTRSWKFHGVGERWCRCSCRGLTVD
uniref:Inhibitor I9 domain-containing protein n=1 Tax=Ananas comosus var. bracteatus TaxID=296719 RepID=A0A6V7PKS3_ANACO|nr:unnamed protein product [Ananas comosus var. bracteatus]